MKKMKSKKQKAIGNVSKKLLVLLLTLTLVVGTGVSSFADQSTGDNETKGSETISQEQNASEDGDVNKKEATQKEDIQVNKEDPAIVDNKVEAMSQSINTISPKLAGKSAGGIDITATAPATFRTYTNPSTGLAPSQLNVALAVSMSQADIEGAYIELPYDGFMPSLGDSVYANFQMSEDIFSLEMPAAPASDSIVDSYVNDTVNHKLIIKLKKTTTTVETLNIKFNYNPAYDAKIPSAQIIWKDLKATVKASDNSDIAVSNTSTVKAETFSDDLTASLSLTSTEVTSDQMPGIVTYTNKARDKALIDSNYENFYYIDVPIGFDFSPKGFFADSSKVEVENITGYTRYKVKFQDTSVFFPSWTNNVGGVYQLNSSLSGFANLNIGESVDYRVGTVYKKINGPVQSNERIQTLTKSELPMWEFTPVNRHSQGSNTPESIVDISKSDSVGNSINTAGNATFLASTRNTGASDVNDFNITLYQKNQDYAKIAFNGIAVYLSRESTSVPLTKYKAKFEIKNANTSATRETETGVYSAAGLLTLPTLSTGEYIDKVIVIPMGVNGTDEGHLPSKNSINIVYSAKNWNSPNWPDGTPISQTKTTQVKMGYTINYLDESDSNAPTEKAFDGNDCIHYYAPGSAVDAYAYMVSSNSTSKVPGDTVNYEVQGYNGFNTVANEWKSPELTVAVPKALELQNSIMKTDYIDAKNGTTYPDAVNIKKLPSSDIDVGYNFYRLTTDKSAYKNISGGTNLVSFKMPLKFKVASGTTVGTYNIHGVAVSGDDFVQVTRNMNNLVDSTAIKYGYDNSTSRYSATTTGHTATTVASLTKLNGATSSRANASGTWTNATYFGVEKNTVPQMKSEITNVGNTTFTNARLYNILPYGGDARGSSGNVQFAGITGIGTVYYTTKPVSQLPSYTGLDLQTWTGSTLTTYGFSTTAPSDLSTVTAVYVDYGTTDILPNGTLDSVLNFKIPNADNQIAVNQFAYSAKEKTSTTKLTTTSDLVTFSTEIGQVTYHDNIPVGATGTVTDMPDPISQTVVLDTQKKGSLVLSPSVPKLLGYTFTNWKDVDNNITYNPSANVNFDVAVNSDTILDFNAQWTPNVYSVQFDSNSGTGTMTNQPHTYDVSKVLTSNTYTKAGYTFDGWNTKSDGTGTSYADGASVKNLATDNGSTVTLYAKWIPNTYKVKFDANTGSGTAMSDESFTYDVAKNLDANTYTKAGYTFAGWNTLANGTGTNYADGASVTNLTTTSNATVTLYAKWTPITYKVKFDANTGSGTMTDQNFDYGTAQNLTANAFTKTGYTFAGWTANPDGTGTSYTNSASANNLTETNGGTVTLYAKWTPNTYKVRFNNNGGTGSMSDQLLTYDAAQNLTTNVFTKAGCGFAGWTTNSDGTGTSYADGVSVNNLTTTNNDVINLYAKWTANEYSITYVLDGGTNNIANPMKYTYGNAKTLVDATKVGYTFEGWYDAATGGNKVTGITVSDIGDKTLYARWTSNTYKVHFEGNGETSGTMTDQDFTYDTAQNLTANAFAKTGYTFAGWTTVADGATTYSDSLSVNNLSAVKGAVVTLYAKWTPNTYKVHFDSNTGSGTMNDQDFTYDEEKALTSNGFEKAGYAFTGWSTESDGTGTSYTNSQSIKNLTATNNEEITLYANWEAIDVSYKVEHYKMNADGTYSATTPSDTEDLIGLTDTDPTATAKDYTGYTYDESLTTYGDSTHEQEAAKLPIAGDGSLVIKYHYEGHEDVTGEITTPTKEADRGDVIDYTIKIDNKGTINSDEYEITNVLGAGLENVATDTKTTNSVKKVASTTKAIDSLVWDVTVDANGNKVIKTKAKVTETAGNSVENSITLKNKKTGETINSKVIVAVKETPKNKVTVSFNTHGGNYTPADQLINKGETAIQPKTPTKENNEFQGWYVMKDGKYVKWNFSTKVYENVTVHTLWEKENAPGTVIKTGDEGKLGILVGAMIIGLLLVIGTRRKQKQ